MAAKMTIHNTKMKRLNGEHFGEKSLFDSIRANKLFLKASRFFQTSHIRSFIAEEQNTINDKNNHATLPDC